MLTPSTDPKFENKPDDFWALNHPTAKRIALNDCARNDQFVSVSAQSCHGSSGPAYVFLIINGHGFSINSANTQESTRALAEAFPRGAEYGCAIEKPATTGERVIDAALAVFIGVCLAAALVSWWSS